jgi:hypothetical protein
MLRQKAGWRFASTMPGGLFVNPVSRERKPQLYAGSWDYYKMKIALCLFVAPTLVPPLAQSSSIDYTAWEMNPLS